MRIIRYIGVPCLLIVLLQLATYPYVFHILFNLPSDNVIDSIFFIVFFALCLIVNKKGVVPSSVIKLMAIQSFFWLLYSIVFYDTSYLVRIFLIILTYLCISLLCKYKDVVRYAKVNTAIFAIQGVLGVVGFILVYINVLQPILTYYYSEFRYLNWYVITCSNATIGNFIRVGGFFDEPGAFAFWGVFALVINKITIDNRKMEIVILISLLFTFSAAYFIILPLYLLFFYHSKIKTFAIVLLVLVPVIFIAFNSLSSDDNFMALTMERFSGGEIKSSRYELADHTKEIFLKSPVFGVGAKELEKDTLTTDNPYEVLAKDGVLGFVITYLPLIYLLLRFRRKPEVLYSSTILFIDYMQRPFHINELHFFMLYFYCTVLVLKYEKEFQYNLNSINV